MTLPKHDAIELPLLSEILAAGGEVRPAEVYPRMRKHFPGITDADLALRLPSTGGNAWTNRVQWARQRLVEKGELFREPRGIWRITPKGEARVKGISIPVVSKEPDAPVIETSEKTPAILAIADPVDALCERMLKAQQQSSAPRNFEAALADAFRFLGFDVTEQGKAGETDVLLGTHIGSDSYRVVVDAKATHGDKVGDNQIKPSIGSGRSRVSWESWNSRGKRRQTSPATERYSVWSPQWPHADRVDCAESHCTAARIVRDA